MLSCLAFPCSNPQQGRAKPWQAQRQHCTQQPHKQQTPPFRAINDKRGNANRKRQLLAICEWFYQFSQLASFGKQQENEQQRKREREERQEEQRKMLVGVIGVSVQLPEQQIRELFSKCGPVRELRVYKDRFVCVCV